MKMMNRLAQKDTPCRECERRHAGCHGDCELYSRFQEERSRAIKNEKYQRWLDNIGYIKKGKK